MNLFKLRKSLNFDDQKFMKYTIILNLIVYFIYFYHVIYVEFIIYL